jgi:hypothetical protein
MAYIHTNRRWTRKMRTVVRISSIDFEQPVYTAEGCSRLALVCARFLSVMSGYHCPYMHAYRCSLLVGASLSECSSFPPLTVPIWCRDILCCSPDSQAARLDFLSFAAVMARCSACSTSARVDRSPVRSFTEWLLHDKCPSLRVAEESYRRKVLVVV